MAHHNSKRLSIHPAPIIDIISNNVASIGINSHTMIINGQYFSEDTFVHIPGIDVNSVQYIDENTLNVTVGPIDNTIRSYPVYVSNGQTTVEYNGFSVDDITTLIPGTTDTPWENIVGSYINTGVGMIEKNSANSGWNHQGTFGTVPANRDFTLTINPETLPISSSYGMFGMNATTTTANYNDIDYALYISNNTAVRIYENGSSRGNFGGFAPGDQLRITRVGSTITYYNGANILRTVNNGYTGSMIFDCSLYRAIRLNNISLSYPN